MNREPLTVIQLLTLLCTAMFMVTRPSCAHTLLLLLLLLRRCHCCTTRADLDEVCGIRKTHPYQTIRHRH